MRLSEYEDIVKLKIKNDPCDPDIYNNLQQMIKMFLVRKKVCKCDKDYEDMSYEIAGDLFLEITKGLEIEYYLGYLEKIYRKYAHQYYQENCRNLESLEDCSNISSEDYPTLSFSSYEFDCAMNRVYLEKIDTVINHVMVKSCKYNISSQIYLNLKLSLILTLLRNKLTYFHLSQEQEFYLKVIVTNFHNTVVKEGFDLL